MISLKTALDELGRIQATKSSRPIELAIKVHAPGSIGAHGAVAVEHLGLGIDWYGGKVILTPAEPLTRLTPEEVLAIEKSVRMGSSWHAFQSYKKQADRIKELEAQVAKLQMKVSQ
jgi:hypothetical protein